MQCNTKLILNSNKIAQNITQKFGGQISSCYEILEVAF